VDDEWRTLNLANWEERVGVHLGDGGYDLSSHRAGAGRLDAIVAAELGPLAGLRVLHLQCHIGHDTVALAHNGAAEVVGVDFSPSAIAAARALAEQCGVGSATFVHSDLYSAPDAMPNERGRFDLVFTTWGTITWLPDLDGWARVVRHFLKPGGAFYFADAHPTALVFDDVGGSRDAEGRPGWLVPYFERAPQQFDEATDYADPTARLANSRTVQWMHPLSDIVASLHDASLRIEWLHEYPRVTWRMFPSLVRDEDGLWTWPDRLWLPLSLSLRAVAD
jgi:SAM-dependent methyltransferase